MAKKKSLFERSETSAVAIVVHCAHDVCNNPSIVNIKVRTGRANVCRFHYDQHFQIQADLANAERGLTTADQMRAWCKQKMWERKPPGNWWAHEVLQKVERRERVSVAAYELVKKVIGYTPVREPGSDDDFHAHH
jgi:hypothetical protein